MDTTYQFGRVAVVLTVRMGSRRLPGKVLTKIQKKPLAAWILERLKLVANGVPVIATTNEPEDNPVEKFANEYGYPIYRGDTNDVVNRINEAVRSLVPDAAFVFRALGDCPFIDPTIVNRSVQVMFEHKSEAFLWQLAPDTWPVYGAREFPFSRQGWNKIMSFAKNTEREHSDSYFHKNRDKFEIVYHEPPSTTYFRNYRLEIDWQEDLQLVEKVAENIGMLSPTQDVIRFLDENSEIASINQQRVEITGPLTSYDYQLRRNWMRAMNGKPVVLWDGTVLHIPEKSSPIFCNSGRCLLGYGKNGVLYKRDGDCISGDAFISCSCGTGRYWKKAR